MRVRVARQFAAQEMHGLACTPNFCSAPAQRRTMRGLCLWVCPHTQESVEGGVGGGGSGARGPPRSDRLARDHIRSSGQRCRNGKLKQLQLGSHAAGGWDWGGAGSAPAGGAGVTPGCWPSGRASSHARHGCGCSRLVGALGDGMHRTPATGGDRTRRAGPARGACTLIRCGLWPLNRSGDRVNAPGAAWPQGSRPLDSWRSR